MKEESIKEGRFCSVVKSSNRKKHWRRVRCFVIKFVFKFIFEATLSGPMPPSSSRRPYFCPVGSSCGKTSYKVDLSNQHHVPHPSHSHNFDESKDLKWKMWSSPVGKTSYILDLFNQHHVPLWSSCTGETWFA